MKGDGRARLDGIAPGARVQVAFESNGRGWLGFIVNPPGAFVRGTTRTAALSKTDGEVRAFLRWAGVMPLESDYVGEVAEVRRSSLSIEDADSEILLRADAGDVGARELSAMARLIRRSALSFATLWDQVRLPDWVDAQAVRPTFWGARPSTAREVYVHVVKTQVFLMSRLGLTLEADGSDIVSERERCVEALVAAKERGADAVLYERDGEQWTLRKVMRRFIWHDRIHAKSLVRILEKQKMRGAIRDYRDPFGFFTGAATRATSRT